MGAFLVAFTLPNLFRRIFGEGALSEAFIPLFREQLSTNGRLRAYQFAYTVLSALTLVLLVAVSIGIVICAILDSYVPGIFAQLTLKLSKILLPYSIFVCTSAVLAGVLNSLGHFAAPAYSPVILNSAMIIALVYICPKLDHSEYDKLLGLAGAILVAGVLQVVILILVLNRFKFRFQFSIKLNSTRVKELCVMIVPGVFSASVSQVNVLVDRLFASWLGGFAVTSLYYSERLIYLPIGLFAVALASACLPEFSRAVAEDKSEEMVVAFFYSIRQILYLTLPFVVLLMMLAAPIVNLIYQRGSFDDLSAHGTVTAILFYAPGIPAFAAVKILRAGFFCRKDTATPAKIAGYCLILNVILNMILIVPLKHCGLALATTISSYVNVLLLSGALYRAIKPQAFPVVQLGFTVVRISISMVGTGLFIWYLKEALGYSGDQSLIVKLRQCLIPIGFGAIFYLVFSLMIGSQEPREMFRAFASKLKRKI